MTSFFPNSGNLHWKIYQLMIHHFKNDNLLEFQNHFSPLVSYNNTETYGGLERKSTFEGVELELENGLAVILEALDNERNSEHNSLGQNEETGDHTSSC